MIEVNHLSLQPLASHKAPRTGKRSAVCGIRRLRSGLGNTLRRRRGAAAGTGADGATFSSTGTEVALGTAEDSGVAAGVATGTTVGSGVDIGGVTDGEAAWGIGVGTAIAFLMGTGSAFRMRTGVGLGVGVENAGEAGNAGIAGVISPPGSDDELARVASRRFASSARTWYPAPKGIVPAFIPERYAPSSCGSRRSLKIGRGSV